MKMTHSTVFHCFSLFLLLCCVASLWPAHAHGQDRTHSLYFEGTDYELHVYRVIGKEPGKTLLLIGGIQGDEPGGFLSADHYIDITLEKGNLIVVPRANLQSIVLNRRKINADMNRKFADDTHATYETEVVAVLKELMAESDMLLNLHDGSGFFSETYVSEERNPRRYGQSIISDAGKYVSKKTGQELDLAAMAQDVCEKINPKIKESGHHFHFNNHRTANADSVNKEQRKSATFYALTVLGIPAFGVETSKSLPLELKVRHHNLAINAFMEQLEIVTLTPGLNLAPPQLKYLVVAVNDSLPHVVENQQTLFLQAGDTIKVSHIEANYERGLTADVVGLGGINDVRKKIRIDQPTRIVVRKDYYPSGSVYIKLGERRSTTVMSAADSSQDNGMLFFKVEVNDQPRYVPNHSSLSLLLGDRLQLLDVLVGNRDPSQLVVNFKGFVGDTSKNTGEDRGYVIQTANGLMPRFSVDGKGRKYPVVVSAGKKVLGKMFVELKKPKLRYVVLQTPGPQRQLIYPGETLSVPVGQDIALEKIVTDASDNLGLRARIKRPGRKKRSMPVRKPLVVAEARTKKGKLSRYRLDLDRHGVPLGSVFVQPVQEIRSEE